MLGSLRRALTTPASFFDDQAADPDLTRPAVVVFMVGLAGILGSFPVFRALLGGTPAGANSFLLIGVAVGVVAALLTPFVLWLIYAGLFHGLTIPFDGEGEFRDLFALVGWGFAPRILANVVSAIVMFVLLSEGDMSSPQQAQQFAQSATTSPLGLANQAFALLMTLWSAWIWTHAVAAGRDLPVRKSAISVGVVVAVAVLISLGSTYLL